MRLFVKTSNWVRLVLVWAISITALVYVYVAGGIQLLIVGTVWGACSAIGVERAIHNPSNPARGRKTTTLKSILGYALLLGTAWLPALIALFCSGPLVFLSLAIAIVFSMSLTASLCTLFLGPTDNKRSKEPHTH